MLRPPAALFHFLSQEDHEIVSTCYNGCYNHAVIPTNMLDYAYILYSDMPNNGWSGGASVRLSKLPLEWFTDMDN